MVLHNRSPAFCRRVSVKPATSCTDRKLFSRRWVKDNLSDTSEWSEHTLNPSIPRTRTSCGFVQVVFQVPQLPHDFTAVGLHLVDLLHVQPLPPRIYCLLGISGWYQEGLVRGVPLTVRHVERKPLQIRGGGQVGEAVEPLELPHGVQDQVLITEAEVVPPHPRGRVHHQHYVTEPVVTYELHGAGDVALDPVHPVARHQQPLVLVGLLLAPQHLDALLHQCLLGLEPRVVHGPRVSEELNDLEVDRRVLHQRHQCAPGPARGHLWSPSRGTSYTPSSRSLMSLFGHFAHWSSFTSPTSCRLCDSHSGSEQITLFIFQPNMNDVVMFCVPA